MVWTSTGKMHGIPEWTPLVTANQQTNTTWKLCQDQDWFLAAPRSWHPSGTHFQFWRWTTRMATTRYNWTGTHPGRHTPNVGYTSWPFSHTEKSFFRCFRCNWLVLDMDRHYYVFWHPGTAADYLSVWEVHACTCLLDMQSENAQTQGQTISIAPMEITALHLPDIVTTFCRDRSSDLLDFNHLGFFSHGLWDLKESCAPECRIEMVISGAYLGCMPWTASAW